MTKIANMGPASAEDSGPWVSRWWWRCPHGCGVDGYCTACHPRIVGLEEKVRWLSVAPKIGISKSGPVLPKFPRWKGAFLNIDFTRTLEKWSRTWWPPDHEMSPVDRRFRPSDREMGGYRQTRGEGYKRGLSYGPDETTYTPIRTVPDFDETEEAADLAVSTLLPPHGNAAHGYYWTERDFFEARFYRPSFVTVPAPPAISPLPFIFIGEPEVESEKRVPDRPLKGLQSGTVPYVPSKWVSPLKPETCTDEDIQKWRHKYWKPKRAKHDPMAGHRYPPTASKRDLQDQSARMKMYAWGSHDEVIDSKQMLITAIERVAAHP